MKNRAKSLSLCVCTVFITSVFFNYAIAQSNDEDTVITASNLFDSKTG